MNQQGGIGAGGIIVLVVVGLWLWGSITGDDDREGDTSDEPPASLVSPSDVSVVRSMSFCSPEPFQARVRFVVWISNRSPYPAEVDVLPVRYYSDGEDNRSILDLVTATIEPGRRQFIDQAYAYNAQEHGVVRCAVKLGVENGLLGDELEIRVAP